ncbi:MAG: D-glycero-beta-D-manno-heptose 1-phosphate adenylyltransferase [Sphingomonadales bacterium]|nr:D-glycero-beta-D-manno-heptose 1-phosphate adenylyltransferase [Sphingomonadales bacterium]
MKPTLFPKLLTLREAHVLCTEWRAQGFSVVFTNGCFDLLHPGHLAVLQEAAIQGDRLVVGLNTDASVTRLKGPTRPVQKELARAAVLAALQVVDAVVLFDEDDPALLIGALQPEVLVKGGDYVVEQIVGAEQVIANGGRVHLVPTLVGHSTTALIQQSKTL